MSDKDIVGVELVVLSETTPDAKNNWKKVRLVQWIIDGKSKSVKLERRGFYKTEDGDIRTGKAEGFTLADLDLMTAPLGDAPTVDYAALMKRVAVAAGGVDPKIALGEVKKIIAEAAAPSMWGKIKGLMKNPPAYKPEPKPEPGETIEEVPF